MNKFNLAEKFWLSLLRNAEGEGGGGAGEGSSGADAGAGEGGSLAAPEPSPPATTFLTEAGVEKPAGGEAPAEGEKPAESAEAPAPFDATALTLPEGFELPEGLGKSFAELLDNKDLTAQERGQKLVDLHAESVKTVAESMTKANMDLWKTTNDGWRDQIKELPEFKANPDAEAGKVMQVLASVGAGEDFFKALDMTGAGNHPAILQVLHRLATPFMEGGAVQGLGGSKPTRQLGANIYTSAAGRS